MERDDIPPTAREPIPIERAPSVRLRAEESPVAPATSFFGREAEIQAVRGILVSAEVRLLTLTGPGGVGKTRLALQILDWARDGAFEDAAFVSLAAVTTPRDVPVALARAMRLREADGLDLAMRVVAAVRGRRFLFVFDNLEHLPEAGLIIADLLRNAPSMIGLATSREPLNLTSEWLFPLAPFTIEAGAPGTSPAVRLFEARARTLDPAFAVTEANATEIAAICASLDGLPLAIELAAARIGVLSPKAIMARLDNRLALLGRGRRDSPARQQTMRETITWSYELLDSAERRVFRTLAVFANGFGLDGAEQVLGHGDWIGDAFEVLSSLAAKNLLVSLESDGEPRFTMLETIREFGRECLHAAGEWDAVGLAHAEWALALAETANDRLRIGPDQLGCLRRLSLEHDNLRAALEWLIGQDAAEALRLASMLSWYWYLRGQFTEGVDWLERTLDGAPPAATEVRIDALLGIGLLAHRIGLDDRADAALETALTLAADRGIRSAVVLANGLRAILAEDAGDFATARDLLEGAFQRLPNGDPDPEQPHVGLALAHLGVVAWGLGDYDRARELLEEALAFHQDAGDDWGAANARANLGWLALDRQNVHQAALGFRASLPIFLGFDSLEEIALGLEGSACLLTMIGKAREAARFFGSAESVRARSRATIGWPERSVYEAAVLIARRALGGTSYAAAVELGRATISDQAVAEAVALLAAVADAPAIVLSERERAVLELLADSKSDKEIADLLFISPRTAQGHVARLFARLGVNNRASAVAEGYRLGLINSPKP